MNSPPEKCEDSLEEKDFGKVLACRQEIARELKKLGFAYASLDLKGYRTGSMNEPQ